VCRREFKYISTSLRSFRFLLDINIVLDFCS
jgi:hypothetical protein